MNLAHLGPPDSKATEVHRACAVHVVYSVISDLLDVTEKREIAGIAVDQVNREVLERKELRYGIKTLDDISCF